LLVWPRKRGDDFDPREAVKALIVANGFLEGQVAKLRAAVTTSYSRAKFGTSEITYDVTVTSDDGIAPAEPIEYFNPNAAWMRASRGGRDTDNHHFFGRPRAPPNLSQRSSPSY
jgi:hypothetical protein